MFSKRYRGGSAGGGQRRGEAPGRESLAAHGLRNRKLGSREEAAPTPVRAKSWVSVGCASEEPASGVPDRRSAPLREEQSLRRLHHREYPPKLVVLGGPVEGVTAAAPPAGIATARTGGVNIQTHRGHPPSRIKRVVS